MAYKDIAKIALDMEALALASESYGDAGFGRKKKKFKPVKSAVKIITGASLIKPTAQLIGDL